MENKNFFTIPIIKGMGYDITDVVKNEEKYTFIMLWTNEYYKISLLKNLKKLHSHKVFYKSEYESDWVKIPNINEDENDWKEIPKYLDFSCNGFFTKAEIDEIKNDVFVQDIYGKKIG